MDRTKTVDLSEAELEALAESDKVVSGVARALNAPAGVDIKTLVAKCLRGPSKPVAVPGGLVIALENNQ